MIEDELAARRRIKEAASGPWVTEPDDEAEAREYWRALRVGHATDGAGGLLTDGEFEEEWATRDMPDAEYLAMLRQRGDL